jgi:hypothetical protein
MNALTMNDFAHRYFPALLKNAVAADEYAGWNPQAQVITNVKDDFHFPQVQECIREHAHAVVAFAIVPVFDEDSLSIELQFVGEGEALAFDKAYRRVRLHKPKTKGKGPVTKLLKHRMYILPDGREFLLFGKWDQSRRIGKVIAGENPDGTGTLANEIVDDDVLRKCRLIPKGEEPWTLA